MNKDFFKSGTFKLFMVAIVAVFMVGFGYTMYAITSMLNNIDSNSKKYNQHLEELHQKARDTDEAINNMNKQLDSLSDKVTSLKEEQSKLIVRGDFDKTQLKNIVFDSSTDLKLKPTLSIADMNKLIDAWDKRVAGGTGFTKQGAAFIEASRRTGYNPVYLFAHAAAESSWGSSHYAVSRGNFFGINARDSNPDAASHMGTSVKEGIVEGGKWIDKNFYKNGYCTLDDMRAGNYATDPRWSDNISQIVNASYRIIAATV